MTAPPPAADRPAPAGRGRKRAPRSWCPAGIDLTEDLRALQAEREPDVLLRTLTSANPADPAFRAIGDTIASEAAAAHDEEERRP